MIHIYAGLTGFIIVGYLLLRYLDGDFKIVSEEIIEQGYLTNQGRRNGKYFIIKRTYSSGRIKIIRKDLE